MSTPRVGEEEDEERRRQRKLEEALEVKSLRRIVSAYLKYAYFSHIFSFSSSSSSSSSSSIV